MLSELKAAIKDLKAETDTGELTEEAAEIIEWLYNDFVGNLEAGIAETNRNINIIVADASNGLNILIEQFGVIDG